MNDFLNVAVQQNITIYYNKFNPNAINNLSQHDFIKGKVFVVRNTFQKCSHFKKTNIMSDIYALYLPLMCSPNLLCSKGKKYVI